MVNDCENGTKCVDIAFSFIVPDILYDKFPCGSCLEEIKHFIADSLAELIKCLILNVWNRDITHKGTRIKFCNKK